MELDHNNSVVIHHFIALAEDQGWNWAAFDWPRNGQVDNFHGFASANEAIWFCDEANNNFSYAEQNFIDGYYHYLAVDTLRLAMETQRAPEHPLVSMDRLLAQLTAQDVGLMRSQDREQLLPAIQAGSVFPVVYDREIDPKKEIDRFIVLGHHHAGHQVYEVGHSIRVMDEFSSLGEAERSFAALIRQYHDNTDQNDYQLIGLYRGFDYQWDMDGTPENYSGLTLKHAFYQYDPDLQAKAWRIETDNDISQPKSIRHFLYARYDTRNSKFKLMDERLNEVSPQDIKISTYPNYFINEQLTIKQLNIMNEQSYDYVKNQLLYLGFGEDIAQPLREKMEQGLNEFTLSHTRQFGKDETQNVLHFSRGDDKEKDLTFFNRFDVTLRQDGKADLTQTFFVGQQYNYTLQERYNMMDGRFAYREQPKVEPREVNGEIKMVPTGETYLGWKGLNFKESDQYGNFLPKTMFWNHEKELVKYPIKELAEPYDHRRLLNSLEKGNKANVTIVKDGQDIKGAIAANPRMQRFDFYDANGQSLIVKAVEKQKLTNTEKQEQRQQEDQTQDKGQSTGVEQAQQTDKKESRKAEIAEEQNNNIAPRKKQGVHI